MRVVAVGADVPAFEHEAAMPAAPLITEPGFVEIPLRTPVRRDQPLRVAWRPTGASTQQLQLHLWSEGGYYLTATFDDAAGEGAVSAALLSRLPAGNASLWIAAYRQDWIDAGAWPVSIERQIMASSKTGCAASGWVTLE